MRPTGISAIARVVAAGAIALACVTACEKHDPPVQVVALDKSIPDKISYNWDIRPILSENCFRCHGNDAGKRKAGLRLDNGDSAFAPVPEDKEVRAIVPGKPWDSEMIRRILSDDPDELMPPKGYHKLSPFQQAILYRWVERGARYEQHWAYVAPEIVDPDRTDFDKQAVNPIDRYIYTGLKSAGLKPSPEADRETLINRVTLDLTGLPPTLEQVDAFVADKSTDAYEKLVDRLLASPTYGERMATYWMDVARYGESDGYLDDNFGRLVYPWRDWAISAFNRNMPYNQFATWQLAGDKLKNPTQEQLLATTFARVGKRSTENGIIDEEYRVEYRNERSELVGKAFLGLTVGCAKCHDHKYDVISQADYYSFAGFFNSIDERGFYAMPKQRPGASMLTVGPTLPWPTPEEQVSWDKALASMQAQEAAYNAIRLQVGKEVESRADTLMRQRAQATDLVKASVDGATVAYYPFDDTYEAPFDPIMSVFRFPGPPPAKPGTPGAKSGAGPVRPPPGFDPSKLTPEQREAFRKRMLAAGRVPGAARGGQPGGKPGAAPPGFPGFGAAAPKPTIPANLIANKLIWTHSGRPNDPGAVLQNAQLVPGVRGKAFLIDDSLGFLGPRDVGRFERNQDFSVDLWVKPRGDKEYESATIVNYQDHNVGTGDNGYTLISDHDHLRFDVIHMSPNNMISVATVNPVPRAQWTHVTFTYDGSSKARGAKIYINGAPAELEVRRDHLTRSILPISSYGSSILGGGFYGFTFGKRFRAEEFTGGAIDEVRIFNRELSSLEVADVHDPASVQKADKTALVDWLVDNDPRVLAAKQSLRDAREAENQVATQMKEVMILGDQPKVRPTFILDHGLYDHPTNEVQPQGLDRVFRWSDKYQRDRIGLTDWLFDKKNPLTARVFVNRLWQLHFGTGIVETVDDFGTQGARPTNLPLLDWLSIEFVKSGWDIKHMQKLMVMSATYRQSSQVSPDLVKADPRNQLLARGPRYRLQAEMIRDNALFASGLLVTKIGGASVFPYQPDGVWEAGAGVNVYPADVPNDDQHRRSMYTFIKRASQAPSLTVFDQADRSVSTVARQVSNTPLQALVLLNDVQFMEAYRKLAERAMLTTVDRDQQIQTVFRLATRRRPYPQEMSALQDYYASESAKFIKAPDRAEKILAEGVAPIDPRVDHNQLAALTMVTGAVMNSPDAFSLR